MMNDEMSLDERLNQLEDRVDETSARVEEVDELIEYVRKLETLVEKCALNVPYVKTWEYESEAQRQLRRLRYHVLSCKADAVVELRAARAEELAQYKLEAPDSA